MRLGMVRSMSFLREDYCQRHRFLWDRVNVSTYSRGVSMSVLKGFSDELISNGDLRNYLRGRIKRGETGF
jgi:hypothetical protein